jgi:hypothetical protein
LKRVFALTGVKGLYYTSQDILRPNLEKALIEDILYFDWYTTGVTVYDDTGLNRLRGHDSDFFILHQRCMLYHLDSHIQVNKTYTRLVDSNKNISTLTGYLAKLLFKMVFLKVDIEPPI